MKFNDCVSLAGLGPANQNWGYGWLSFLLLVFLFFILVVIGRRVFRWGLFLFFFIVFTSGLLFNDNDFLFFGLGLEMGKFFLVTIEVEQLRNSVWLAQRRVNVHVPVSASSREVLVSQFAKGNNLSDGLSMRPSFNGQLILLLLSKHNQMAVTLAAHN